MKLPKIFLGWDTFAKLDFYKDFPFNSIKDVDTAISAFWLLPASFLERVGLLDENIFYSPEDVDYCMRVHEAGFPVCYYPEIECVHITQQITHRRRLSRISLSHLRGLAYYFRKHRYLFSASRFRTPER